MPVTVGPYVSKRLMTGKESSGRTTISKVALGDYEMTDVPAMLSEIKDDNDKLYSAVIGLGVLQNFIITFDWKNKWIVLEK
jgi:predicted aspartyl protease